MELDFESRNQLALIILAVGAFLIFLKMCWRISNEKRQGARRPIPPSVVPSESTRIDQLLDRYQPPETDSAELSQAERGLAEVIWAEASFLDDAGVGVLTEKISETTNLLNDPRFFGDNSRCKLQRQLLVLERALQSARRTRPESEDERSSRIYVRLIPQVPIVDLESPKSWFGGTASLPDDVEWPTYEGERLFFFAQIDCRVLPEALWRGDGPRTGWLSFFITGEGTAAKVLHTASLGKPRSGPSVKEASWHWHSYRKELIRHDHLPRWPLEVLTVQGEGNSTESHPVRRDMERSEADARKAFDVRIHRPFDWESIALVIETAERHVSKLASFEPGAPSVSEQDEWTLQKHRDISEAASLKLRDLRRQYNDLRGATEFSEQVAERFIADLDAIKVSRIWRQSEDASLAEQGEFGTKTYSLASSGNQLGGPYFEVLFEHARYAYCANPQAMLPTARAFFEGVFAYEARNGGGTMGHVPEGYFRGNDDKDVFLLELDENRLLGWSWWDVGAFAFILRRHDLQAGCFDRAEREWPTEFL